MRKLSIIGIGAGNPDHLTVQAIKALSDIDVVFLIDKGSEKDALAQLRREICERHIKKPYRIVDQVAAMQTVAFELEVIPGITSMQALAARHKIALNRIGGPVQITTGRRLAGGMPREVDDVVVMLDGEGAFKNVSDGDIEIYWGAYLGMPDEILLSGKLPERAAEIERIRDDARRKHGWIMDTYLLRRGARS